MSSTSASLEQTLASLLIQIAKSRQPTISITSTSISVRSGDRTANIDLSRSQVTSQRSIRLR